MNDVLSFRSQNLIAFVARTDVFAVAGCRGPAHFESRDNIHGIA